MRSGRAFLVPAGSFILALALSALSGSSHPALGLRAQQGSTGPCDCEPGAPPSAGYSFKAKGKGPDVKGFDTEVDISGGADSKGTFKTGDPSKDTPLLLVKACCFPCVDVFFYRGVVDSPIKLNDSGLSKCGPAIAITLNHKKDKDGCKEFNSFFVVQEVKQEVTVTRNDGTTVTSDPEEGIDAEPGDLLPVFGGYTSQGVKGDAEGGYLDWPGPRYPGGTPPAGLQKRVIKQTFRTWVFAKKGNDPACIQGRIDWGHTMEETFAAAGTTCTLTETQDVKCNGPLDADDLLKTHLNSHQQKVEATPEWGKAGEGKQKSIRALFDRLRAAKACPC